MNPSRIVVVGSAALVAFLVVAALGAGYTDSGDWAAKVDGREVSEREYLRELEQFRENEQLHQLLPGLAQTARGSAPGDLGAAWLSRLVQQDLIDREVERRDVRITDRHRELARNFQLQQFQGEAVLGAFDDWFEARMLERDARFVALVEALGGRPSEEELRERYEAGVGDPSQTCAAHILVETQEQAVELKAQIDQGADFAELAGQFSIDPGSGQQGGDLGCNPPGTFVEPFEVALDALAEGQLSEPVQSEFGWHLILRERLSFEEARAGLEQQAFQEAQGLVAQLLAERVQEADIEVNPKYGSFELTGGGPAVVPPVPPDPPQGRPSGEEPVPEIPGLFPPGQ